jgi:DnaJ-domain-containing protein 1
MFDDLKVSEWWFLGIAAFAGYLPVKHFLGKLPGNQTKDKAGAQALPAFPYKASHFQSEAAASSAHGAPLLWHQVLEVDAGASREEIMQAYQRKIQLYHPDKLAGLGPEVVAIAEAKSKEIHKAYQQGCAARSCV